MYIIKAILACAVVVYAKSETIPWPGPFADHIPGQLVSDTREVAAAKLVHSQAHKEVRAVLPQLPIEQIFPEIARPTVIVPVPTHNHQSTFPHPNVIPQVLRQPASTPPVMHFADLSSVQLSSLGEVPEVAAARKAHLDAVAYARSILPPLVEKTTVFPSHHQVPQSLAGLPVDTPEVAAAKLEHARAFAAFRGF